MNQHNTVSPQKFLKNRRNLLHFLKNNVIAKDYAINTNDEVFWQESDTYPGYEDLLWSKKKQK